MNYIKIIRYCNKYSTERYAECGVPLTYNKLKHIVNDHTNKKTRITTQAQSILIFLNIFLEYSEISAQLWPVGRGSYRK